MTTATFIRKIEENADARLYQLSEPIEWGHDWDTDKPEGTTKHIVVSAVVAIFTGAKTYIFPANEDGEVIDWCEMSGSYRGGLSHEEALSRAGFTID